LLALDPADGDILWEKDSGVFGTWLSYSKEHGILLQAGRPSRDMVKDDHGNRMVAYRAEDGSVLWDKPISYGAPPILHGSRIITREGAFSLYNGDRETRVNPLTGERVPWEWKREYGCNYPVASEFMLTFRSAAAGYFDLEADAGTGNLGGFKSGCTSNLVAANGILNAPDYTRTCSCSYQNQTSLGLIHDPEVEMWTYNVLALGDVPIRQIGINLGSPGDRLSENGTLWLEFPFVGGPSPEVSIRVEPEETDYFRYHSSCLEGEGPRWIGASGAASLSALTVSLSREPMAPRPYTVRLYFTEPEELAKGMRTFDVSLQGKTVVESLDIVGEAGRPRRVVVKEFPKIPVTQDFTVSFWQSDSSERPPILCGLEAIAE
jgi:hypothetical protein